MAQCRSVRTLLSRFYVHSSHAHFSLSSSLAVMLLHCFNVVQDQVVLEEVVWASMVCSTYYADA